ncbi:hypothetical protein [Demequina sp. NBRC 110057]|uniref:hypothetical protein n=1 Tax=Demequina sp. NBRC 110057 TaxID=1570346 RepID=UPI0009FFCC56|nr:hypothetical protein [Demequina sp. NBRC 110057]
MSDLGGAFDLWSPVDGVLPDLWLPTGEIDRAVEQARAACDRLDRADDVTWASAAGDLYRAELSALRGRVAAMTAAVEDARDAWWSLQAVARGAGQ